MPKQQPKQQLVKALVNATILKATQVTKVEMGDNQYRGKQA